MSWTVTVNPTLTGGTATDLLSMGISPGRANYLYPGGTRSTGTKVTVTVGQKGTRANPVESTGIKLDHTSYEDVEGCCTTVSTGLIFDLGVRRQGKLDDDATELAIARFRALVNDDAFPAMVLTGQLPQ